MFVYRNVFTAHTHSVRLPVDLRGNKAPLHVMAVLLCSLDDIICEACVFFLFETCSGCVQCISVRCWKIKAKKKNEKREREKRDKFTQISMESIDASLFSFVVFDLYRDTMLTFIEYALRFHI